MANTIPNITTPIINPTNQTPVTGANNLGLLNDFIGTWNSPTGEAATGYNVMPLPQVGATEGYITKNFPYYEEITFAPIAGGAPNREGDYTQQSGVLFYEQRVYFATNPAPSGANSVKDALIHAENGSWLYHYVTPQLDGAYGPNHLPPPSGGIPPQPTNIQYNKQVSVPHGNSILMAGGPVGTGTGNPSFSEEKLKYLLTAPFSEMPTIDPSSFLTKQLDDLNKKGITVASYSSINVTTTNVQGGGVSNILFENKYGKVVGMDTTWYVEKLSNGKTQLQYIQIIWLEFLVNGSFKLFTHVDANTLLPVSS